MSDKKVVQCLRNKPDHSGKTIPTDYVKMKKNFKRELLRFYLGSLEKGQKFLDLNAGLHGLYNDIDLSRIEYLALEQNPNIRSFLEERHITVKDWNVPKIPLEDNTVDYVLSAPFIEHLPTYIDALNLLVEIKRVLKRNGRVLLVVPNYLSLKTIFFEDYKHGWVTTKKRMIDMLQECNFEIRSCRYTIGWITMRMNPLTAILRFGISAVFAILRLHFIDRFLETIKMAGFSNKFKKTVFELIVIEAEVGKDD
jgi:SAM-dependent methyltransferase